MPEIRIDRIISGRILLTILSKEEDNTDVEVSAILKRVAMTTATTGIVVSALTWVIGRDKNSLEKVCEIAVDNL